MWRQHVIRPRRGDVRLPLRGRILSGVLVGVWCGCSPFISEAAESGHLAKPLSTAAQASPAVLLNVPPGFEYLTPVLHQAVGVGASLAELRHKVRQLEVEKRDVQMMLTAIDAELIFLGQRRILNPIG